MIQGALRHDDSRRFIAAWLSFVTAFITAPMIRVFHALNSRLSQRIVSWVFLSLVAVEAAILIPSYFSRERELLRRLEEVSSEVLIAVKSNTMAGQSAVDILNELPNQLKPDSVIVGGSLHGIDGNRLAFFGEIPEIPIQQLLESSILRQRNEAGDRYDVAWPSSMFQDRYILVIRHDASTLRWQMLGYIARIAGLVLIISVVVTGVTFLVLERIVITPILQLRSDLELAGTTISNDDVPAFQTQAVHHDHELDDVAIAFHDMYRRTRHEIVTRQKVEVALRAEREKSDRLLLNILPRPIVEELKRSHHAIAHRIDEATILFADLVDFTGLAAQIPPIQLVELLNHIFSTFDHLAEHHGLEKIKTIGDAYMAVGGVTTTMPNHAVAVIEMAIAMQGAIATIMRHDQKPFQLRIGINTGPVVAGVIGVKKFSYDLWGDAVNIASRMESHGLVDKIHVSESTYEKVKHLYNFDERGDIDVKGRGRLKTYVLRDRKISDISENATPTHAAE